MATSKQAARRTGGASRPAGDRARARDKGTRGGRPEPQLATPAGRGQGNGQRQAGGRPARAKVAPEQPVAAEPERSAGPPLWLQIATLVLSLGALGVSIYLTIVHYSTTLTLACPNTGVLNCEKVTTSPESVILGIPVAVLGLVFAVFMVAITTPWAWRSRWQPLVWARLGSVIVGMGFVLYLIYTELFTVDAICLWCTSVHVITFALFALIVYATAAAFPPAAPRR